LPARSFKPYPDQRFNFSLYVILSLKLRITKCYKT